MKRPAIDDQTKPKRAKHAAKPQTPVLASYQDIIDALASLEFTTDQLCNLSKLISDLYSLKVNPITQHFPTDLVHKIFQTAQLPNLPLNQFLTLRTVSQSWNKVVCSFSRINTDGIGRLNYNKLFQVFPLRYLDLSRDSSVPLDFSIFTGLTTLRLQGGMLTDSDNLMELAPLTNLKKLTLCNTWNITSLGPLTSLTCLSLKYPCGISKSEVDKLPQLTKLISDNEELFDTGYGVLKKSRYLYDGEWQDGVYHGQGIFCCDDYRYEGQWIEDRKNGYGVCYYFKEEYYEGVKKPWKIDKNGPGINRYEGNWKDDQETGYGVVYYGDGDRYQGQWEDGEKEGQGIYWYADGDRYEGGWYNGLRSGQGIQYFSDGTRYEGAWQNDDEEGHGIWYGRAGDKYEGQWKDAKRHGQGTETNGGETYVGQWKNGFRHGHGILTLDNGERYDGEWNNDEKHGQGVNYDVDGNRFVGQWKNGKRRDP